MNWLTQDEIKNAAKTSDLAAMECAVKHWEQLWKATPEELEEGLEEGEVGTNDPYCALCEQVEKGCEDCPIVIMTDNAVGCSDTPHRKAHISCRDWRSCPTVDNWHTWKRAARAEYEFLLAIYQKMQVKE